ncbi:MAG: peptidoglycan-binding domain-containing protein [bacterium]|nr:peptidoglycan-binding domain-containing protein [bacterium]
MSNLKKSRIARITSGFVGLMTSVMMMGGLAVLPAAAASVAEIQAQIDALLAQVQALQGGSSSSSSAPAHTFSVNLRLGSSGADVMALQKALNANGVTVSTSGAGSPGNETSFFGPATQRAVIKFQEKYASETLAPVGLSSGTGFVGALTRAKLNSMSSVSSGTPSPSPVTTSTVSGCTSTAGFSPVTGQSCAGSTVTTPAPITGGALTASAPASIQPANALAPASAARIPFTKVVLTAGSADVTVNSLTVERTGPSADSAFSGVDLLDEQGLMIGLEKTINSDHKSVIGIPIVIKAGTSRTLTIAATRAAAGLHGGEQAYFQVVAIDASGATVGGEALPLKGALHTVNESLTIGTISSFIAGPLNPSAQSKPIGTLGYTFAAIKFSAGSAERVWVKSIRWNQAGSAASGDLTNIKSWVNGTSYDTSVSSDGKYYTAVFGNGILLDKGGSAEIAVSGDIVGGSGRTVSFDVYRNTDLAVVGETFGYTLVPPTTGTAGLFGTTNPWFNGADATVQSGTMNVSKASAVAAQNIAINLANQPLGGFEVEVKGEPVSVTSLPFKLSAFVGSSASASTQDITDVKLVDASGKVVAGPIDITATSPNVTFTDTVTFPIGKNVYTLKGKVGTDFATDQTIAASTTPSDWTSTGGTTGNSITATPSSAVTGNTMTVKAAVITVTNSASPAVQTVVAGAQNFNFANIQLDASASGEDIKFTTLKAAFTNGGTATHITGCALVNASGVKLTTGSNEVNPTVTETVTFTFDSGSYVVPKGTAKSLALNCNIAGSATTSSFFNWGIPVNTSQSTATGVTSGQTATPTTQSAATGQTMTIAAAGTLTVTKDSSSPSYAIAAANTTGNVLGVLKFHAANEAISLQKLALQLTNPSASSSPNDLVQVTLWNAAGTQVGSAVFTGSNRVATSTLVDGAFIIPKDGDALMTIKGDLQPIGTSQIGRSGALVSVDYDGADSTGTQGKGLASGATVNQGSSSDTAVDGVRVFRSYPTITMLSLPTNTLDNGTRSIMRFKITANSTGDIGLYKFSIRVSTTTATVTSINAYAYTDSGFSTAVSGVGNSGKMMNTDLAGVEWAAPTTQLQLYPQTTAGASTTIQISAGQSRYFDITGTVTASAAGASISTQLEGDAAYMASSTLMMKAAGVVSAYDDVESDTNDDFIWSPNSTTTSVIASNDWTNGFGIVGLNGTNNTAVVVSK